MNECIARKPPTPPIFGEICPVLVLYHRKTTLYHLVQLKPSKSYELRVSYPSTTPTDFYIRVIPREALHGRKTRKILNIEKLVFDNGLKEQYANVTAVRTGLPYNPASLAEPVVYNIVLEELLLGIPWHTWRLGVLVLLIVYIAFKYLVPCFLLYIEENLRIYDKR
ncbi:uncharacterized protein LOC111331503 isoform X2 [Stylophora pistillata]|uniref:uncharacterized protein LOC111331503 isoform X2 n=1 Tax=Stylophora pistillata TaxID=50429 RepID=UPI000C041204|nr:uncharacterized protein LOC111331503 isoform X2 [Stylophora pistillata]XP_022792361.1 uncharacterized protein LOC111331503 isoform X2 [Stylophora pistillata]